MKNPLMWVLCVGALCAAILGNELSSFLCFMSAFLLAAGGNVADIWLAIKKAKQ